MDANPPTTADFAASSAHDNQAALRDAMVLIGWLAERVRALEAISPRYPAPPPLPVLPTMRSGFDCISRREQDVRDAWSKILAHQAPLRPVVGEEPKRSQPHQ